MENIWAYEGRGNREWRKLQDEELNDLHCSPNIVRVIKPKRMGWARHVARMGESRGVYRVLVKKREGEKSLGRPRHRWRNNIQILKKIQYYGVEKIHLTRNRKNWLDLLKTEVQPWAPDIAGRLWSILGSTNFSRTLFHEISYLFKLNVAEQIQGST